MQAFPHTLRRPTEVRAARHVRCVVALQPPSRGSHPAQKARVWLSLPPHLATSVLRRGVVAKTSTLEPPPAPPAAPEGRPEPPMRRDDETTLSVTVYISGRKQWGGVSVTLELVDEQGNKCTSPVQTRLWTPPLKAAEEQKRVSVRVPKNFGKVGAAILTGQGKLWGLVPLSGQHNGSIYLDRIVVNDHEQGDAIIWCHSWVGATNHVRRFFTNTACLPHKTPAGLTSYRGAELHDLRGEEPVMSGGKPEWKPVGGARQETDRMYDYQVYNDLSGKAFDPNKEGTADDERPTLGGGAPFHYPRRLYTGRPDIPGTDKESHGKPYLPLDERFDERKATAFTINTLKSLVPWAVESVLPWRNLREFTGFDDVSFVYRNTWEAMLKWLLTIPGVKWLLRISALPPVPTVAAGRSTTWDDDLEFGRQALAGMHPCVLQAVTDYAQWEKTSAIRTEHLHGLLDHHTLQEAMADPDGPRVFCIDYATLLQTPLSPEAKSSIIDEINNGHKNGKASSEVFQYAPRCLLFRNKGGKLAPVAVELCLPGREPVVVTPNDDPLRWRLAKTHFLVADSGYHQLISHWLRTHACVEPFIIATMRCLSVMHPLWKLLRPHFKYTMHINANARGNLVNANGIVEKCFNPQGISMALSARVYEGWRFDEQALPADLLARGMLVPDDSGSVAWKGSRYSIVMGDDYPYAADGMLVWDALHKWFKDYLDHYYRSDSDLYQDSELQNWWTEVRTKGHPDTAQGWPQLSSLDDLVDIATTIAWLASGHHAAVNFGQFAYSGYFPNYPSHSRRDIPAHGTPAWADMAENPDVAFLSSFSSKTTALQVMGVVELLSTHDAGEEYLATRTDEATWTSNQEDKEAWKRFQDDVKRAEKTIKARNANPALKHRYLKYELLMPSKGPKPEVDCGPPPRGVPNSVSI